MARAKYKFVLYKDKKGEFRWRLSAGNGQVIADSGEGYTRKANCQRMVGKFVTAFGSNDFRITDETKKNGPAVQA